MGFGRQSAHTIQPFTLVHSDSTLGRGWFRRTHPNTNFFNLVCLCGIKPSFHPSSVEETPLVATQAFLSAPHEKSSVSGALCEKWNGRVQQHNLVPTHHFIICSVTGLVLPAGQQRGLTLLRHQWDQSRLVMLVVTHLSQTVCKAVVLVSNPESHVGSGGWMEASGTVAHASATHLRRCQDCVLSLTWRKKCNTLRFVHWIHYFGKYW